MEGIIRKPNGDPLQRRVAAFIAEVTSPHAIGGTSDFCIGTSIGAVREQNQDRSVIVRASYPSAPERDYLLGVVCDGIGGLANGAEAATLALSFFVSRVVRTPRRLPSERLREAALIANQAVHQSLTAKGGATLSAALVTRGGVLAAVNVGDSRIYGITQNSELRQLSQDDTLAGILGSKAPSSPDFDRLVQFVGMGDDIEPHIFLISPGEHTTLLLTTGGIHSAPRAALSQALRSLITNVDIVRRLLSLTEAFGGRDNGTALVLPTEVRGNGSDGDPGLVLTLWSASDRLEIWIPVLAEEPRQQPLPAALNEARGAENEERDAETNNVAPSERKPSAGKPPKAAGRRPRRSTKKKSDRKAPGTDDESPPLDIKFPDRNEE